MCFLRVLRALFGYHNSLKMPSLNVLSLASPRSITHLQFWAEACLGKSIPQVWAFFVHTPTTTSLRSYDLLQLILCLSTRINVERQNLELVTQD